jgi:hypothetical protein
VLTRSAKNLRGLTGLDEWTGVRTPLVRVSAATDERVFVYKWIHIDRPGRSGGPNDDPNVRGLQASRLSASEAGLARLGRLACTLVRLDLDLVQTRRVQQLTVQRSG